MTYNDTTNKNGILQMVELKTDLGDAYITGDATRLKQFTALVNNENHKIWHAIFMSNGNWQYDDGGYTNLPQSATDLVSGTSLYALPSEALTIQRVECKDASGLFYQLTPITKEILNGVAIDEFMKTDSQPFYYRLVNGTIELFPAPNYASVGGLKVYFDRDSVDFATSDTTKTPGFASPYHELVPNGVAIEWLKIKQPNSPTLPNLIQDYMKMEANLKQFYAKRFKDKKPVISRAYQTFK